MELTTEKYLMKRLGHVLKATAYCAALLLLADCSSKPRQQAIDTSDAPAEVAFAEPIIPAYAEGFHVHYTDSCCLLEIADPQLEQRRMFRYALVPRGCRSAHLPEGYTPIEVPVRSVICMTSLQLSNFIKLDELQRVTGITSTRHLFNATIREQLAAGKTHKIGIEGNFDNEVILGIHPDVILISPFKRGGYDALREVGIPLIPHLGYKETSPLGQAEWVKFVGLLTGTEAKANRIFADIEKRYLYWKELAAHVTERPTVFSGDMRGGNWYAAGGRSFLARLFEDAGADYFLKDNPQSGGVTFDFETVYEQAATARYWRIVNSYPDTYSYEQLKAEDARYADFRAFREKGVIYCNMTQKPYYESMPVEPDCILADLIHVFHPELMPADYEPAYYDLLR